MRRSTGLLFLFACGTASLGCQDFDAFATGTAGAGGSTSTSTGTTGGGGAGPSTGGGGTGGDGTGGGGGSMQLSCFNDTFSSQPNTLSVFATYQDTGAVPDAVIGGDTVTLTANSSARGGLLQKATASFSDCVLITKLKAHGDGVATYLALYEGTDPGEHIEVAFVPAMAGPQRCINGVIDGMPVSDCVAVDASTDELRISVQASSLVLEARANGIPQGMPGSTVLPTWISTSRIALGVDSTVSTTLAGTDRTSSFESLGNAP